MALRGKPGSPGMGKLVMPSEYISFSPWFLELHCGDTTHNLNLLLKLLPQEVKASWGRGLTFSRSRQTFSLVLQAQHQVLIYLLQLLQTLRDVEGDVDECPVGLILEHE